MSLARAVLSGTVYRKPEKRFTGNDIPITTFTVNIDEKEQSLIRVVARGNNADAVESSVSKGDKIIIEGRLQMTAFKAEDGTEKKILELDLSGFEVVSSSGVQTAEKTDDVVKFGEVEMNNDVLIGEEEIPF